MKGGTQITFIPKGGQESQENRSDVILRNLFPKLQNALFELNSKYAKPGKTLFYCHFCESSSEDELEFKSHLATKDHEEKVEKRRKYLADLIESFYTAVQNKATILQKTKAAFNVCAKCLMPYLEGAKKHRASAEHNCSIAYIRPACFFCNRLFASRIDQELHQVSLDHIYCEVAYERKKAMAGSKPVEIPEEYDENVAVGMEYVRQSSAFFCTPCGLNFRKTLRTLKDHCAEPSHIENVKLMEEKLKPVREARKKELENAPPAKKLKMEEETENPDSEEEEDGGAAGVNAGAEDDEEMADDE